MMEQNFLWKNLTGTACVLGIAISSTGINGTQIVESVVNTPTANYSVWDDQAHNSTENTFFEEVNNAYLVSSYNRLEMEVRNLFGEMREATVEESASVSKYVKSISKKTGVNFFDLC